MEGPILTDQFIDKRDVQSYTMHCYNLSNRMCPKGTQYLDGGKSFWIMVLQVLRYLEGVETFLRSCFIRLQ